MSDGSMPTRFRVATWVINERRDQVYNGSIRETNPLEERTAITVPLISVDMRLTQRLGAQVQTGVPFIARTGVVQRPTGELSFRDEVRGLGDTMVGLWYRDSHAGWTWTFNGGLSLPTGSSRKPVFRPELENGSLVPMSRLQRGSGTWDPLFGVSLEHALAGAGEALESSRQRGRREQIQRSTHTAHHTLSPSVAAPTSRARSRGTIGSAAAVRCAHRSPQRDAASATTPARMAAVLTAIV